MNVHARGPAALDRLVAEQPRILAMIHEDQPLPTVLEAICRAVEAARPEMLCSVLLVDEEGEHLLHGAAPSLPEEYCEAIHGITIGDGVGSCGTAAATGRACFVEDVTTHPNWAAFKGLAHDTHGLRSCWSTPILAHDGRVVATFAIYHRVPRLPALEERKLIDFSSHLVTIAVNRDRERSRAEV